MLTPGDLAPAFHVQPVFGLPVAVGEGCPPTVILFLRSLGSSFTRSAVQRVQDSFARFDTIGVRVVAFCRTGLEQAQDFIPRYHILFPVVVDETGQWFDAFAVGRDRSFKGSLRALPNQVSEVVAALKLGHGSFDGLRDQLPAAFVVGRDGRVRYAWYGASIFDQPDMEALYQAVQDEG